MSEEKEESLQVNDRRRFTSEGDSRDSDVDLKRNDTSSAQSSSSSAENFSAEEDMPGTMDFSGVVVSFATQALVFLGEVPHPETRETVKNVEAAKQMIDILGVLEEKTKGNLTEHEQRLLDEVLASVRLAFVNSTK